VLVAGNVGRQTPRRDEDLAQVAAERLVFEVLQLAELVIAERAQAGSLTCLASVVTSFSAVFERSKQAESEDLVARAIA
jgi:hypothetical protein